MQAHNNFYLCKFKLRRVYIVHGWGGNAREEWFPWLKKELEKRNFYAGIPIKEERLKPYLQESIAIFSDNDDCAPIEKKNSLNNI